MLDSYNRKVSYMRISVTDRCNLKCKYCITEDTKFIPREHIISSDMIVDVVKTAVKLGFSKFRLTGGEPLVRPDIIELVRSIAAVDGVDDFGMTTNAILLPEFSQSLKNAGLDRINIHVDTLSPEKFKNITCGGALDRVIEGIEAAKAAGFENLKINCVNSRWNTQEDIDSIRAFAAEHGLQPRFIREMSLEDGEFWPVDGGEGGKCGSCNRIRMSCDGKIYPCLFSDQAYSIHEHGIEGAFQIAVKEKPESGVVANRNFNTLGG